MWLKALSLLAAVLMLGACETTQETGSGGSTGTVAHGRGAATPGSVRDFEQSVGDRVFFDFDRYDIRADQRPTLDRQAEWLGRYQNVRVTIEGHCDERGTREYNLALGERRAVAVRNYLMARGVAGDRISTISYGKERPAVPGHDDSSWSQNRRGVTVLTGAPVS